MQEVAGSVRYSATDLVTWLGCGHASWLNASALTDPGLHGFLRQQREQAETDLASGAAFPEPSSRRGLEHEAAMLASLVAQGLQVVTVPDPQSVGLEAAVAATNDAMRAGVDVVFQAAFLDDPWLGLADFLVRVDGVPSSFGDYAYEIRDTKLARHATANALLQMAHYGAMLELVQGTPPPRLVVWLGNGEMFTWGYSDAAPYLREVRERFLAFHAAPAETDPEPVQACGLCRWAAKCDEKWGPQDLRHVHRLTGPERLALRAAGIETVAALAVAPEAAKPSGMHEKTFERLRAQAAAQAGTVPFELIRPQDAAAGVAGTPAPHPLDLYLDLEGDPFAALPTLDYLWAYCDADGSYHERWAHSPQGERDAVSWLLGEISRREALGGDWRVYHYNTYEQTSIRRVLDGWPDQAERPVTSEELDALFKRRFDDLYRRVELGVRTLDGSTSLKVVEKIAGYDRTVEPDAEQTTGAAGVAGGQGPGPVDVTVGRADDSIKAYEAYLQSGDPQVRAALLSGIRRYNVHDVRATLAVHRWLRTLAGELIPADLTSDAAPAYAPSAKVQARIDRTAALQVRLCEAADAADSDGGNLPSGLSPRGARMVSSMLEWHRNETIVAWADFRRLAGWALTGTHGDPVPAPDDPRAPQSGDRPTAVRPGGTEGESVLFVTGGPTSVEKVEGGPRVKRVRRTYPCQPGAWKIKRGSSLTEALPEGSDRKPLSVTVTEHDAIAGTFSFESVNAPDTLGPLVVAPFTDPESVWESLIRLGDAALTSDPDPDVRLALRVLARDAPLDPQVMARREGENAEARGLRLAGLMRGGLLPVQGPPGTGKTRLAAKLVKQEIEAAAASGRTAVVGVVAGSHKVIANLLKEVRLLLPNEVDVAHVGSEDQVETASGVDRIEGGSRALHPWVADHRSARKAGVVGATKFGWSGPDAAGSLDLLIVDEAGQVSLADALAVMHASPRVVALGDPQQLAAPVQAKQAEDVQVSLLEHVTQKAPVMPDHVGVFLDVSYRMHAAVCSVVAALAYEGQVRASDEASARDITGSPLLLAGSSVPVEAGVVWLPVDGDEDEQAAVVAELVERLRGNSTVTTEHGTGPLTAEEILVVAPHNAHVNRITTLVPDTIRVGTVDKFQGQQGHVVVFAMGRRARSAQDVRFSYEINRLNVALSRARLMVVVVAHPDACFPPVGAPEDLLLASRFNQALKSRRAASATL